MRDQATQLRNLIARQQPHRPEPSRPGRSLALVGGKGGTGTTTIAVQLAAELVVESSGEQKVLLVDGDLSRGDVAAMCGLQHSGCLQDVIARKTTAAAVLQMTRFGFSVLASDSSKGSRRESKRAGHEDFDATHEELFRLRDQVDLMLVDAGTGDEPWTQTLLWNTEHVLFVTNEDAISVMDTYALLKDSQHLTGQPHLVVSQAASPESALDVHYRLETCCRKFLGRGLPLAGVIPLRGGPRPTPPKSWQGSSEHCFRQLADYCLTLPVGGVVSGKALAASMGGDGTSPIASEERQVTAET